MPRPSDRPSEPDERLTRGANADPPPGDGKATPTAKRNDAALPGSQNSDLKGAKRDRTLRGATT
ncbi:MAG TPA: hypothetical protein VLA02_16740 [Reyranella sp.]|nr:hypothetical protein [Reyranella sp.]